MIKTLLLLAVIVLLAILAGQEMYKVRKLSITLNELERTKRALIDRRGKEVIHDELGNYTTSQKDNNDVKYDPAAINELYTSRK